MRSRNRFSGRLFVLAALFAVAGAAILYRMADLTLEQGDGLRQELFAQKCRDKVEEAYRGSIIDRNDAALATTMAASRVSRESKYVYEESHARVLAPLLSLDNAEMDEKLRAPGGFRWLSRGVDVDTARAIRALAIPGIGIHRHQHRSYPQGNVAAHVIGFTGSEAQGLEGIELTFDERLVGEPITAHVCTDIHGRVFQSRGDLTGVNRGPSVHLTVDATLQSIVEAELAAKVAELDAVAGTVVMMEPSTGEILALANAPSFDPNSYGSSSLAERRNRAVADLFEPGSTLKAMVVAAALDTGMIEPSDEYFCENGRMMVSGWHRPIRDHHPYGTLDITGILRVSSNICTAKIGAELGPETLHRYLKAFGFDRKSGIRLNGEARGLLLPPEKWRPIKTANVSFGQGISVSALQMASAFATLANDGVRMQPRIVRKITDQYGGVIDFFGPEIDGRVVSADVARTVTRMLETVVSPEGTAKSAMIEGVRVAGKTGTAQKAENGTYAKGKYVSSFVGFLPAEAPRLVIAVMVDEPKGTTYGGLVAGPVFRDIALASLDYLGIPRSLPTPGELPELLFEAEAEPEATDEETAFEGVMPDLSGLALRAAARALAGCDCRLSVDGAGYVVEQDPPPGDPLAPAAPVRLTLASRK